MDVKINHSTIGTKNNLKTEVVKQITIQIEANK
jgi:hypothetical protein